MDLLERLEAVEEIKKLRARIVRARDTHDWDLMSEQLAPDVEVRSRPSKHLPERAAREFHGREEYLAAHRPLTGGLPTAHHSIMPEIEITSDTTATGVWAWEGTTMAEDRTIKNEAAGFYHETYVRLDGAWKIKSLIIDILYSSVVWPEPKD